MASVTGRRGGLNSGLCPAFSPVEAGLLQGVVEIQGLWRSGPELSQLRVLLFHLR